MITIKNEKVLIKKLKQDIKECNKDKIVFLAGHFPLFYSKNKDTALEVLSYWGKFSIYTLKMACKLGKYSRKQGKKIEFIFFIDDHAYEEISGLHPRDRSKRRSNLYKLRNGEKATLPNEYKKIMKKYGFNEDYVLRHDHNKAGRNDCLYFSEKILRTSTKKIDNACAREYTEFLEDPQYFNKKQSYLIAFVPNRCQGHICNVALAKEIKNINASHVFIETLTPNLSTKGLYKKGRGVTYRKDYV